METTDGTRQPDPDPDPDREQAQASLRQARRAGDAIRYPATPFWFFVLNAALMALLVLTQLLDSRASEALIAVGVAIIAVNLLAAWKAGVIGAASATRGQAVALVTTFAVILGSFFVYDLVGRPWVLITGASAVAALVLVGGWMYQRAGSTR